MRPEGIPDWGRLALELLRWSARRPSIAPETAAAWNAAPVDLVDGLRARRIDSLLYLARSVPSPIQEVYETVWSHQHQALCTVYRSLREQKIRPILWREPATYPSYFDGHPIHMLKDIKLLARREELAAIRATLYALGYRQGYFEPSVASLIEWPRSELAQEEHRLEQLAAFSIVHELEIDEDGLDFLRRSPGPPIYVIDNRCYVTMEIDLHFRVTADTDCLEAFERAEPLLGGEMLTLSLEDHVFFLASLYYHEVALGSNRSLREFACLAPMVADPRIDWNRVIALAVRNDARPALYYYLTFLDQLIGSVLPRSVLESLCPRGGRRDRDWGWQLSPLFGAMDPEPLCSNHNHPHPRARSDS